MSNIRILCAARCGAADSVPAQEEKKPGFPARAIPVQAHPYVCLTCWLDGWRSVLGDDGVWVMEHEGTGAKIIAVDWDKDVPRES